MLPIALEQLLCASEGELEEAAAQVMRSDRPPVTRDDASEELMKNQRGAFARGARRHRRLRARGRCLKTPNTTPAGRALTALNCSELQCLHVIKA